VWLGTNPLSDTPQEAADREPRIVGAKAGRFEKLLEDEFVPQQVGGGPQRERAMFSLTEMAKSIGADVFARQERALQRRRDQQNTLRRITQPTLILAGEDDQVMTPLEDPEGVTDALYEWMRQPLVLR